MSFLCCLLYSGILLTLSKAFYRSQTLIAHIIHTESTSGWIDMHTNKWKELEVNNHNGSVGVSHAVMDIMVHVVQS